MMQTCSSWRRTRCEANSGGMLRSPSVTGVLQCTTHAHAVQCALHNTHDTTPWSRVLTQHPHHVDALSCRAYALRKLHRLQDAADGYAAALAAAGPDADASTILRLYNAHGYCLAMLGDLHSAVATYSAALALDPTNAHALHNRGTTRLQVGDVAGAVCDFEALVKLDPAHAGAQQQLEAALARLHVQ